MNRGFTLIELIVVIIIVGILASVGMTQYTKLVEKGRAAEARLILGSLRTAEIAEYQENGAYAGVSGLGVSAPTSCASTHYFSYSCNSTTGTCTATRCTTGGKTPQGGTAYTKTVDVDGNWGGSAGY
ncbi:MAG: prepilin-type N-terminal cleavage/methylation domain-containing protein [Candidatus Omnitrophota bacterium]